MFTPPPLRSAHPYYMHDCIHDQPEAIAQVLDSQAGAARELAERIASRSRVHVVGIGTSWHASLVGEYLFREIGRRSDARAWNSFEFAASPPKLDGEDVVIVMSHRGTKQASREALTAAKRAGAATALVTGQDSEAEVGLADTVLYTSYQDRSSAFTISHTTAMTALAMVAVELGGGAESSALAALPEAVEKALQLEPQIQEMARRYRDQRWYAFAGWGPNASTAYEVALKINEAAYSVTTAFQLEQFLHGPFVATETGCLVTLVTPPGFGYERSVSIAKAVKETGADVAALVQQGDSGITGVADLSLALPPVPEFLTPTVYLAPLQLLTYWLALEAGQNPDTFRLNDPKHKAARNHYSL